MKRICKFSDLPFGEAEKTHATSRNMIQSDENQGSNSESISYSSNSSCELVSELDVVVIDPSSGNNCAVEASHSAIGEQSCAASSKESSDGMSSEYIASCSLSQLWAILASEKLTNMVSSTPIARTD